MTPDWQVHDCRVTLRAMKRFGMVPGNDSRTMFGILLGHLLRCCRAFAKEAAASEQQSEPRPERRCAEGLQMAAEFE